MESPVESEESPGKRENEPASVPVLVKSHKDKHHGRDIELNNDIFKIGRGTDNNAEILDVSISRYHCVIEKHSEHWKIKDSSSSGTFLNGTKLIKNVTYPLKLDDQVEFGNSKQFVYILKMCQKEDSPEVKRAKMEEDLLKKVSAQQRVMEERQDAQMKEMEDKILLKQKQTEDLMARLDDLNRQKAAVEGDAEEKDNQIRALEEQIKESKVQISESKENQSQLQEHLKTMVDSMTDERRQLEAKLVEERSKWQEALDLTKQEKQIFENNMQEQMRKWQEQTNNWKAQQLATMNNEIGGLKKKLEEAEKALKEKAEAAGRLKSQVLETVDLTGDSGPSTSKRGAEFDSKIMTSVNQQLTCSICDELFVMATTLNCTHTFCSHCIRTWRTLHANCPLCRTVITSMNRALVVDNFIDDAVSNLDEAEQQKRLVLHRERRDLEATVEVATAPAIVTHSVATTRRGGAVRRGQPARNQQAQRAPQNPPVQAGVLPQTQVRPPLPNRYVQIRIAGPITGPIQLNQLRLAAQNTGGVLQNVILPPHLQRVVQQLQMPAQNQAQRPAQPRANQPATNNPQRR